MPFKKEEAEEWVRRRVERGVKREMEEGSVKTRLQCRKRAYDEVDEFLENEIQSFKQRLSEQKRQSRRVSKQLRALEQVLEQGNEEITR